MATAMTSKMMPLATPSAPGEKCSSLVSRPPSTSKSAATMAAVVGILGRRRRLVPSAMSAVASRNGTSAILGPIPISSSRNVSMTKAASNDSRSFIELRPACLKSMPTLVAATRCQAAGTCRNRGRLTAGHMRDENSMVAHRAFSVQLAGANRGVRARPLRHGLREQRPDRAGRLDGLLAGQEEGRQDPRRVLQPGRPGTGHRLLAARRDERRRYPAWLAGGWDRRRPLGL